MSAGVAEGAWEAVKPRLPPNVRFSLPEAREPHVAILDVDLAYGLEPIPGVDRDGAPWSAALVLVRIFTEPLAMLMLALGPDGISAQELALAISAQLSEQLASRISACGLEWTGRVPTDGLRPARIPPFLIGRERALRAARPITVAICTRNRPAGLSRLLRSLHQQEYPSLQVVVVDNAPSDDRSRRVTDEHSQYLDLTYVVEPRPGLSRARNRSIEVSDGEIIAWVDDDEECDRWMAAEIARSFFEHPAAGAVNGMILPAELETSAQLWFERYGGHCKGRDFTPTVFSRGSRTTQSPLYPLPPFGAGGSMAFTREAIEDIGRFDCALGAGTPTLAGEDTAAFSTLLVAGGTVVWQPTVIVRHWHRREHDALRKVFHGYGRGLSAFYASIVVDHPESLPELVRLVPRAFKDLTSREGLRLSGLGDDFPRDLLKTNLSGLAQGPAMYLRARLSDARASRTRPRADGPPMQEAPAQ
jgi:glycosyltransferase involved in cell wall biosynthesis